MASLADELMNDLDDLGSGSELDDELDAAMAGPSGSNGAGQEQSGAGDADADGDQDGDGVDAAMAGLADGEAHVPEGGVKPAHELDEDAVNAMDMSGVAEVTKVAKLQGGRTMRDVLQVRTPFNTILTLNVSADPTLHPPGDDRKLTITASTRIRISPATARATSTT